MDKSLERYYEYGEGSFTPKNKDFIQHAIIEVVPRGQDGLDINAVVEKATKRAIETESRAIGRNQAALVVMPARVRSWIDELVYRGTLEHDGKIVRFTT